MPSLLTRFSVGAGGEDLTADSALVARSIGSPGSVAVRPPANPVPDAAHAGTSPITHVVYIVRENRTFDQEYGNLGNSRSDVNADPSYQMLPSATPQGHAITNRYAFSDNFFSDGEASVQGHWWTSSANVDDYIEKSWRQNYSNRNRPGDVLAPIAEPKNCSLFQSTFAKSRTSAGAFSLLNYGEFYGAVNADAHGTPISNAVQSPPGTPPPNNTNPVLAAGIFPFETYTDLLFPNAINGDANLGQDDRKGSAEFLRDIGVHADGTATAPANGKGLANFNYLVLPEDHHRPRRYLHPPSRGRSERRRRRPDRQRPVT